MEGRQNEIRGEKWEKIQSKHLDSEAKYVCIQSQYAHWIHSFSHGGVVLYPGTRAGVVGPSPRQAAGMETSVKCKIQLQQHCGLAGKCSWPCLCSLQVHRMPFEHPTPSDGEPRPQDRQRCFVDSLLSTPKFCYSPAKYPSHHAGALP